MFLDIDKQDGEHPVIIDDSGNRLTYGELCDFVRKVNDLRLERSVIFCLCENTAGALAGFIALESTGVVPLLISASIDEGLLRELEKLYPPYYYWVPLSKKDLFLGHGLLYAHDYCLIRTENENYKLHEQLSLLLTTSGSTGSPKLVRHKYGNLESNAKNVAVIFGWTKEERCIMDLPIQYTMGLNVINSHLYVGATILLLKSNLMSPLFWQFIKEQRGTNFTGVPYSYEIMMKLRFMLMDLPHLRTLAEGGGKLKEPVFQALAEYAQTSGRRFIATFGTTETSARMTFLPPELALVKTCSIGRAIPQGELFLVDDQGQRIEQMEAEGELAYHGPNVTMGYSVCREDLAKGDEWQGEYHTKDIARRDADGCYTIIGRKARFLKLFGLRVSLDQCEHIIQTEYSCECACLGTDDQLVICLTDASLAEVVLKHLAERLNMRTVFFRVKIIPDLPKNEYGKVIYSELNKRYIDIIV